MSHRVDEQSAERKRSVEDPYLNRKSNRLKLNSETFDLISTEKQASDIYL